MEEKTTYYRSVLLAAVCALRKLKPCRAVICTKCRYVAGIYERGTLEGWQQEIQKRLTEEDAELAAVSKRLRAEEFQELREEQKKVWHGKLAGRLLADVLEADLMEVERAAAG